MDTSLSIETTLVPRGPACAIVLTDDQVAQLGGGRRPPVRVDIGGRTARVRVSPMGGENLVGLSKAARLELGVQIGDVVTAEISLDESPREVQVPVELAAALAADTVAARKFDALAYTHRKEFAAWVAGAKREQTRQQRLTQVLEMLHEGRTRS